MPEYGEVVSGALLPPGEYWVGDPCYAIEDYDEWIAWLEGADYESNPRFLVAEHRGQLAVGVGTAYGDGRYLDQEGRDYPVDAGLIGLVPASVVDGEPDGMHKVLFTSDVNVSYEDGTIFLGTIAIDTAQSEYEDVW